MPKGSKKRRAAKRKKELEKCQNIVNGESTALPPEPDAQENGPTKEITAASDSAQPIVSLSKAIVVQASFTSDNIPQLSTTVEALDVGQTRVLKKDESRTGVANEGAVTMEVEESKFGKPTNANEIIHTHENEGIFSMEFEDSKLKEPIKEDESTQALANERLVPMANEVYQCESVVLEGIKVHEAHLVEEDALANRMAQFTPNNGAVVKKNEIDQSEGRAVVAGKSTSKGIDEFSNILKKCSNLSPAKQILNKNEGNLVDSFEAEKNFEELKRLKDMAETGLSLAKNMGELFVLILDELNGILAS